MNKASTILILMFILGCNVSAASENIVDILRSSYQKENHSDFEKETMNDVGSLPYFILNNDVQGGAKKKLLDTYLSAVQKSFWVNLKAQNKANLSSWYCPPNEDVVSPWKNPNVLKSLIYQTLSYTPESFKNGGEYKDLISIIRFGLQNKYPCYQPIPKSWKIPGFIYK